MSYEHGLKYKSNTCSMISVHELEHGSCYTRAHKSWHFLHVVSSNRLIRYGIDYFMPAAPVAYEVILEPGIVQFRDFEPRRVHT